MTANETEMKMIVDMFSAAAAWEVKMPPLSELDVRHRRSSIEAGPLSWWRRVVRWGTLGLVLVLTITVAPSMAHSSGYLATKHVDFYLADAINSPNLWRGSMQMTVYSNHRKDILICDQRADEYKVYVQIDPTGAGPPDTLLYGDENYANTGCGEYSFSYNVRKWRIVLYDWAGDVYVVVRDWAVSPLPYADF